MWLSDQPRAKLVAAVKFGKVSLMLDGRITYNCGVCLSGKCGQNYPPNGRILA